MTHSDFAAKVPDDVKAAFEAAFAAQRRLDAGDNTAFDEKISAMERAYTLAGVPARPRGDRSPFPLPSSLSELQRATLSLAATNDLGAGAGFACPAHPNVLRRWLGIDPPTSLETCEVEVEHDGARAKEPLWRALQMSRGTELELFDSMPMQLAVKAFDAALGAGNYTDAPLASLFLNGNLRFTRELGDEARGWAMERADGLVNEERAHVSQATTSDALVLFVLLRSGVPIEERWAPLLRGILLIPREMTFHAVGALSAGMRLAFLTTYGEYNRWSLEMLALWPSAELAEAMLAKAEPHSQRWTAVVAQLREVGKKHPAVAETVARIVAETPSPVSLFVTRIAYPQLASELTDLEKEQLRIGARGYDDQDLPAEARFADDETETSFKGGIQLRSIAGEKGESLYDAVLYLDAGVIFTVGTTEEIAWLSQAGVVLKAKNDALRVALQNAVGPRPQMKKVKAEAKATTRARAAAKTKPNAKAKAKAHEPLKKK
jgi:hypothetical protein